MVDSLGELVELEITNVAHGGVSVSRLDGRVVFVSDTLPGETVTARLTETSHKSFWRAETVAVQKPSEHRVDHVWAEASLQRDPDDRAGGAEFGHINLGWQRELKRQVLVDSLSRFAKEDHDVVVEPVGDDEESNGLGWRTRVRLHVDERGTIGPFAARSHRVIPVHSLPLATEAINEAAPLGDRVDGSTFPAGGYVDLIAPSVGGARFLTSAETGTPSTQRRGRSITETVGEREFLLDEQGFWQVHRAAATTLSAAVRSTVDSALLDPQAANLDLYGGVGLLAAALGDVVGPALRITSVEGNGLATDYAAENLQEWLGASAVTARVDRYLADQLKSANRVERARLSKATVVLDPPRAGAGKAVVNSLIELDVAQVVYVACDPVAFARDVAIFAAGGYRLRSVRAFDLFPHTHHVESVGLLTKDS